MTIFLGWLSRANSLRSGSGLKLKCLEAGEDRTCIKSYLYSWCRGCILNIPGLFFQSGKSPHPHHKTIKNPNYIDFRMLCDFFFGGESIHITRHFCTWSPNSPRTQTFPWAEPFLSPWESLGRRSTSALKQQRNRGEMWRITVNRFVNTSKT